MSRAMTLDVETGVAGSHVELVLLYELYFPTGTVRFCNRNHPVDWDGNTYLGAASVGQVEPVSENVDPTALARTIRFSGIDPDYLTAVLDDDYQGQTMREYLAVLDDELRILDDPLLIFEGRMDEPTITCGETFQIDLTVENRMASWDQPRLRRYNHADHTARVPGDLFFEFVEELQDKVIVWGIYKGPVAPDPLKVINRTLDKFGKYVLPAYLNRPVLQAARKVGDKIADIFGW